jgi:hypothetical protein
MRNWGNRPSGQLHNYFAYLKADPKFVKVFDASGC